MLFFIGALVSAFSPAWQSHPPSWVSGLFNERRTDAGERACVDKQVFFRKPLNYAAVVTFVSPVMLWLIFVVLPG